MFVCLVSPQGGDVREERPGPPDRCENEEYRPFSAHAFRPSELAEELAIPGGSVGTTPRRLEQRGLVRHKGEYWAINAEAYDAHSASAIGLQAVAEEFEGDYYDRNADWDADLEDLDAEDSDGEGRDDE